jgi:predicted nucleotidyltransferase component of viral defense system
MNNTFEYIDLAAWVSKAPPDKRGFREAVHIILMAIGQSTALRTKMIMKGGMLMALRYESSRFTKDADFSTREIYTKGKDKELIEELEAQLSLASVELPYDISCKIQRSELKPAEKNVSFPTLALNIGYAPRSNFNAIKRLQSKQASSIVEIDYSYNEAVLDIEVLKLSDGEEIQAYSLINLMAEKYRSLLQQTIRQRNRRQDVYDLALLLNEVKDWSHGERQKLKELIIASSESRGIQANSKSLSDPKIMNMAQKGYQDLVIEVEESLPEFDDIYGAISYFYENLPWD